MEVKALNKEIVWIDWMKFICIVFVYWCHVGQLGNNPCPVPIPYGPFFVNAFFFVSGYLFFRKQLCQKEFSQSFGEYFKKNVASNGILPNIFWKIAVPSALFSMIDYIPKRLVGGGTITVTDFIINTLVRGTNWFTCSLFIAELVLFLMLCFRFKIVWLYWFIGLCIALFGRYLQLKNLSMLGDPYLPWFYKSGLVAVVFLVAGGVYSLYEDYIDNRLNKLSKLVLTIFLVTLYIGLYSFFSKSILFSVIFGLDLGGFLISLLSIIALIYVCKYLRSFSLVRYVSRHSIGFYFLSASIPYVSCYIVEKYVPTGSIGYLLEFVMSFNCALLAVFLLNKFLPWMFDLRLLRFSKK